ncbi:hypothetical protein RQP53_23780 [Paucibacter sp. APW11]|uniref:Uncharacterized protein n=1 Tax=Roseateles aquae TaxID=3077235 RepID=A0ABU3PIX5_9BURK|nr:hypothetical protein [Paucibacter sp. APW11]MDT9002322.1 hypothetical protein [Paucibacter sp. APW11]
MNAPSFLFPAAGRLASALLASCMGATLLMACAAQADPAPQALQLHEALARHELVGLDLNLQIEKTSPVNGQPSQGVIVKRYLPRGQWSSQGAGGPGHRVASGSYQMRHLGGKRIEERSLETGSQTPSITIYSFDTADSGTWVQTTGTLQLSGHFSSTPSQPKPEQVLAPVTNAGLHVALIIKSAVAPQLPPGVYPTAGLVLQSYATDGTLIFQGFGPGNINSKGTYVYKRLSANTAVEETRQISDFFDEPYTMVYTFKTPTSGTWYQSFSNGLIRFSGTFDTFPR